MAKIPYISFPKVKTYADVEWHPDFNFRKDYGTPKELEATRNQLVTGWDGQYNFVGVIPTEEEIEKLMAKRQALWEELQAESKAPGDSVKFPRGLSTHSVKGYEWAIARLGVFEAIYTTGEGNKKKLIKPKVLGITGNRRGSQLLNAMTVQHLNFVLDHEPADRKAIQPSTDHITTEIMCVVPDLPGNRFEDDGQRLREQVRENETKTDGFKKTSGPENLVVVRKLIEENGYTQKDVRELGYGASAGVRYYFGGQVDLHCDQQSKHMDTPKEERAAWKGVRLVERIASEPFVLREDGTPDTDKPNPDHLPWKVFTQEAFQGTQSGNPMGLRCESDTKFNAENDRRKRPNVNKEAIERPTAEDVIDWISIQTSSGGAKIKSAMKRDRIKALGDKNGNPFTKLAMQAVDQDNDKLLDAGNQRAAVCQFVYGCTSEVYSALANLTELLMELEASEQLEMLSTITDGLMDVEPASDEEANETVTAE